MTLLPDQRRLAFLPLAYVSLVGFAAWIAVLGNSLSGRLVAVIALACAATFTLVTWKYLESLVVEGLRAIQRVSRLSRHELNGRQIGELSGLSAAHPWRAIVDRVVDNLAEHACRAEAAEQARRLTELRIRQLSDQLRGLIGLVNHSQLGVLVLSGANDILLANERASLALDLHNEDLPCSLEQLLKEIGQGIDGLAAPEGSRWSIIDSSGKRQAMQVRRLPWKSSLHQEHADGAILLLRPETAPADAQAWPLLARDVQDQAERPLRALHALDYLLQEADDASAERDEYLHALTRHAGKLEQLSEQLRELSRIESDAREKTPSRFDWPQFAEEAARRTKESADVRSLKVSVRHEGQGIAVEGHRDVLMNAVVQLLLNSVKSTALGGCLTLTSSGAGDSAMLDVRVDSAAPVLVDDGQAAVASGRQANAWMRPGDGVGNPLAKHIICDLHGGSLSIDRHGEYPARLRLTLPARP